MGLPVKLVREGKRELVAVFGVREVSALNPQFEDIQTEVVVKSYEGAGVFDVTIWISDKTLQEPRRVTMTFDTKKDKEVGRLMVTGADILLIASPNIDEFTDTAIDVVAWSTIDGGYVYVPLTDSERQLLRVCLKMSD